MIPKIDDVIGIETALKNNFVESFLSSRS